MLIENLPSIQCLGKARIAVLSAMLSAGRSKYESKTKRRTSDVPASVQDAIRFIKTLYTDTDTFEVRRLSSERSSGKVESTWHNPTDFSAELSRLHRQNTLGGLNIYIGTNPRKRAGARGDANVLMARFVFADFDHATDEETRSRITAVGLPEPTMIVHSGHGVHTYWKLEKPLADLSEWTSFQKDLASLVGSDPAVCNPERIMRLPGFINRKPPHALCRLVECDANRAYPFADLRMKVPQRPDSSGTCAAPAETIGQTIADGGRNKTLTSLAGSMRRRGMDADSIFAGLMIENEKKCLPPLPEDEVRAIANSIGRYPPSLPKLVPIPSVVATICSDTGNNARFIQQHGSDLLFNFSRGQWMFWNGQRYDYDVAGYVERLAKKTALSLFGEAQAERDDARRSELIKHAMSSQRKERIAAMLHLSRSDVPVKPEELDADPLLLNVENGTVDLRTGDLLPHDRSHRITKICRASFDPAAQAPTFQRFLSRIFQTHPALIPFVQKTLGYSATGLTTEQVLFFLFGGGSNGKTTLLDIVSYVLGDYAGKAAPDLLMARGESGHPTEVADLQGLRLVVCSETREGRRFDGARLKELTGETRLKARLMRQDFFEFPITHKVFLYSNSKPIVYETDFGFWRRMRLIPFVETIAEHEKDADLLEKLKEEANGILAWIVAGAVQWHREGLGLPPEVETATQEYRTEMDTLGAFLSERCEDDSQSSIYATALFEVYREWAEENGERTESQKRFGSLLRSRGYVSERCGKTDRRMWRGLKLKSTSVGHNTRITYN